MKIIHNIALSVGEREQVAFSNVGVSLQKGFASFKIDENDLRWNAVEGLVRLFKAVHTMTTKFSAQELNGADYLGIVPAWHHGYPEPADSFEYIDRTFNQGNFCKDCGIGLVQVAPFRIKKPPVWGEKSILQLNWVFDQYFVRPDVWEAVFKPRGIGCRPVLLNSTSVEVESIVQLDISDVAALDMTACNTKQKCALCGREKYTPISRGFYPAPIPIADASMFRSSQYFGSGAVAHRVVLVSASMYRSMKAANIKGVDFKPCL